MKRKVVSMLLAAAMVVVTMTAGTCKVDAKSILWSYPNVDISEIDTSKPMVALTFDDGPVGTTSDATSQQILDVIEENDAHCTFFYVGQSINDDTQNEIKRAYGLGCEIGNHSMTHPYLTDMTEDEINQEINGTAEKLTAVTGIKKFLVRPPYVATNTLVADTIKSPMISASVDSSDWAGASTENIIANVLNNVQDGSIVLMHETLSTTAEAVKTIIPSLIKKGYQLVTVSQMMKAKGVAMRSGYMYLSTTGGWPCTTDLEITEEPEETKEPVTSSEAPAVTTEPTVSTAPVESVEPTVSTAPVESVEPTVSTAPVESVKPTVSTAPAESSDCTGKFSITSEWNTAYNGEFTITNHSDSAISGWQIQFTTVDKITNVWSAELTDSENNTYTISNPAWNGTIPAHSSVTFGISAEKSGASAAVPSDIVITAK